MADCFFKPLPVVVILSHSKRSLMLILVALLILAAQHIYLMMISIWDLRVSLFCVLIKYLWIFSIAKSLQYGRSTMVLIDFSKCESRPIAYWLFIQLFACIMQNQYYICLFESVLGCSIKEFYVPWGVHDPQRYGMLILVFGVENFKTKLHSISCFVSWQLNCVRLLLQWRQSHFLI